MAELPIGLSIFHYNGAAVTLSAAEWKGNVKEIFKTNSTRNGWVGFKPSSAFPAITQLLDGEHYIIDVLTAFTLPGASLTGTAGGDGEPQEPANVAPIANAGADNSITLPTSSVVLAGSGTDSDGTVASYAWAQTIGPNTAAFSATNVAQPTVSGLVEGVYEFRLTVTDNSGATHTDTVQVTVYAAQEGTDIEYFDTYHDQFFK